MIEGGQGGVAGSIVIGADSDAVAIGAAGKTATVRGALVSNTASVTGLLVAGALSSASSVTAAGALSVAGATRLAGSAAIAGSLVLGNNAAYTIGRALPSTLTRGNATYVLGPGAGHATCIGGDLVRREVCAYSQPPNLTLLFAIQVLDAGTGVVTGNVRIGVIAESVHIGSFNHTTTVAGALVADSLNVTAALNAASLSASGALTAAALMSSGAVTVSGSVRVSGSLHGGDSVIRWGDVLSLPVCQTTPSFSVSLPIAVATCCWTPALAPLLVRWYSALLPTVSRSALVVAQPRCRALDLRTVTAAVTASSVAWPML